ncbi:hypothetical protein ACFWFZ_13035 [Streptomyces sp. NPDC060232]
MRRGGAGPAKTPAAVTAECLEGADAARDGAAFRLGYAEAFA